MLYCRIKTISHLWPFPPRKIVPTIYVKHLSDIKPIYFNPSHSHLWKVAHSLHGVICTPSNFQMFWYWLYALLKFRKVLRLEICLFKQKICGLNVEWVIFYLIDFLGYNFSPTGNFEKYWWLEEIINTVG